MSRETERLVHILLCEEIGAETVPDVTKRVLKRARQEGHCSWLRGIFPRRDSGGLSPPYGAA